MTRRKWFQIAGGSAFAAAGSGLYATTIEPAWFDVSQTTVRLPKLAAPLRVLHLSDLHSSDSVPTHLLIEAAREGIASKPDLICLTGDYVSSFRAYDAKGLGQIFRMLANAAPTFAVVGNHDCHRDYSSQEIRLQLYSAGVEILHNRSTVVEPRDGVKLVLAGTGDLWNRLEFQPQEAFRAVDAELPVIALIHNPDAKSIVQEHPWDLMLSGHTHGGQVMIPFMDPYWLPVSDHRYIAGLYQWGGRQLYITRGVGSTKGIRFRCRPEVSVLNLEPADGV